MAGSRKDRKVLRRWAGGVALAMLAAGTASAGTAAELASVGQSDFPTEASEAMALYESWVDDWLHGPVEYLILNDERDVWKDLETTQQREAFIEWFWLRRDADPRDSENLFKDEFYELVARSNQRFRGFPRGWKSDRGRVQIILGRPDSMSRRTGADGTEFTVWTYYTQGRNRAFHATFGEFPIYFIEIRPGQLEIFDPRFGVGSYNIELRRAFEYTIEAHVVDPRMEFDADAELTPSEADVGFVREITGSTMPLDIPLEGWGRVGGGGAIVLPMRIAVRDLLFEAGGELLVARVDYELAAVPESGAPLVERGQANLEFTQQQLAEFGGGSLFVAPVMPVPPGFYEVHLGIRQALAESEGSWDGDVRVRASGDVFGQFAVGSSTVALQDGVGLLQPPRDRYSPGTHLFIAAWVRGDVPQPDQLSLEVVGSDDQEHELALQSARWYGEPAGPMVIEADLPDLPAGEYRLRVHFGDELELEAPLEVVE